MFNNALTVIIVAFALYIIATPYLPQMAWWATHEAPLISRSTTFTAPASNAVFPSEPTIIIPRLGLYETIHEGPDESTLNQGIWRRPQTSTPDKRSNTVFAAHRHTISGPGAFYHLDKIQLGDNIYVYWQSKRYHYIVRKIFVVPPTQIEVESPTRDNRLTLYTCTPLWSFKDRLVVQAVLKDES